MAAVAVVLMLVIGATAAARRDRDDAVVLGPMPTTTAAEPSTTAAPTTDTTLPPGPVCAPVPAGTGPPGPLTGIPVETAGAEQRPALIVKIDNYDPNARPQAGLTRADVVYEEKVEGPLSRFAAVFQSTSSDVGPVRSARSTDISIATPLNRPYFAYSGANGSFLGLVHEAPLVDVGAGASGAYRRDAYRPAPHNLFATTAGLWGNAPASPPPALWPFRAADAPPVAGGRAVSEATYHFGGGVTSVRWVWDPATGTFLRWQNGTPHLDAAWCQVSVANVVVQLVDYVDSGVDDSVGGAIPEAALIGNGDAWVLTGGQAIPAMWWRDLPEQVTTYVGPDDQPIAMAPGRTWVALVPRNVGVGLS